jgi:predicted metal-dependent peptidase
MINKTATDKEALAIVCEGIQELTLTFMLAGLSILGEAVEVIEDPRIKTLATDGRKIYYGPHWVRSVMERRGIEYVMYDMLHEWLHVFMNHVARRGDRDGHRWNIACDIFVVQECSLLLSRPGRNLPPPNDGVIPPTWAKGLSVEEIYDRLPASPPSASAPSAASESGAEAGAPSAASGSDAEAGAPSASNTGGEIQSSTDFLYERAASYSASEEDQFFTKFVEELQQAQAIVSEVRMGTSDEAGGNVSSRMQELTKGALPWSTLLRGDLLAAMGQDYTTYARPRKQYYPHIILPTHRSYRERVLFIAVDVSASVGDRLLQKFITNVAPAAARAAKAVVVTFDAIVREEVHTRHPARLLRQLKFLQGNHAGTSVQPVFDVVDRVNPTAIVVLTDGYIFLPKEKYPSTLWVLPENGQEQPWGRNYKMRVSW